jgi:hypothetical protein
LLRKVKKQVHDLISGGKEFHSVGAENEKERLPIEKRRSGTTSRLAPLERRSREG